MGDILEHLLGLTLTYFLLRAIWRWYNKRKKQNTKNRPIAKKKIKQLIKKHKNQLAVQRAKSVYNDAYGKEITTDWFQKEIPYFLENHIYPNLNAQENSSLSFNDRTEIYREVDSIAKLAAGNSKYDASMSGEDFEVFCKVKLESEGWSVLKTKRGADQGIDLIINKGKRKVGVQCKKYSRPVGNKAVQEVKAGIDHYGLTEGIVLSNNKYTKSAMALASSNKIKLMHYLDTESI